MATLKLAFAFLFACGSVPALWLTGTYAAPLVNQEFMLIFAPSVICLLIAGVLMHSAEGDM